MTTDERTGAEIVRGKKTCDIYYTELIKKLGFPSGVLPMEELEEFGRVKSTGFVWWKCKTPHEYFNAATNTNYSYDAEITAYVQKGKMKKMTGCKASSPPDDDRVEMVEMSVHGSKMSFKSPMGVCKSFPLVSFMNEEEKKTHLQEKKANRYLSISQVGNTLASIFLAFATALGS